MLRDGVIEIGKPGDIGHAVGLHRQAGNATMCRVGEEGMGISECGMTAKRLWQDYMTTDYGTALEAPDVKNSTT